MSINIQNLQLDNYGERLVPGYSHDTAEIVRHRSTYQLFRRIIEQDILRDPLLLKEKIKILDIGCGTGHGSFLLAQIPSTLIYAIDASEAAIKFAKEDYSMENIVYRHVSANDFAQEGAGFHYIVSRHALEHIPDAMNTLMKFRYKKRLLISVPFKEAEGNPFHLYHNIDESFFTDLQNTEFLYENLHGVNDTKEFHAETTNSFTCISSQVGLEKVAVLLTFPQAAYEFKGLEKLWNSSQAEMYSCQVKRQNLETEHQHLQAYCAYLKESNEALLIEHQQLLLLSQQQQLLAANLRSSDNS